MLELVNNQMRDEGIDPSGRVVQTVERQGDLVYIDLAAKQNLLYHRHYLVDPRTCAIVDMRFDQ